MKRHAAIPHLEHGCRIRQIVIQVIEKHVADTPAKNYPERTVKNGVRHLFLGPARTGATGPPSGKKPQPEEPEHVHQAVPVHFDVNGMAENLKRRETECDRIDVRGMQHDEAPELALG